MPEATEETLRVETTEESPVLHRLDVEVAASRVTRAYDRAYRDLANSAQVRGFRRGKVPRAVLERLYAAALAEQIEGALVAETLPDAVERSGLEPVSEPSVDATPPEDGAEFRYSARIEVRPEIEVPDLDGLTAQQPAVDVSDAEVDAQLERLREHSAPVIEEPEGTAAAAEHILSIDFVGRIEGQPFEGGSGRGVEFEIGSGRFVPGFEEQLLGARAGEDREVRVTFPDDYAGEAVRGRDAVFSVHVAELKRRQMPDLDDEFAKDLGDFETLEALRERVRGDLQAEREQTARQVLRQSLLDAVLERTSFEVPPGMVDRQLHHQLEAASRRLRRSVPDEALRAQLERWEAEWRPRAEREVREGLLLAAVARAQGIEVTDQETDARLDALAAEQGAEPDELRKAYREAGVVDGLRAQMVDDRALEFLRSQAKVEETTDT